MQARDRDAVLAGGLTLKARGGTRGWTRHSQVLTCPLGGGRPCGLAGAGAGIAIVVSLQLQLP